jgi:hypothetical protein
MRFIGLYNVGNERIVSIPLEYGVKHLKEDICLM